jgi:hypothetical protein
MPDFTYEMTKPDGEEKDVRFTVTMGQYNDYINETDPTNRTGQAYNFLIDRVHQEDKAFFKDAILVEGLPDGMFAMSLVNDLLGNFSSGVKFKLKKPSESPSK